ncbi:MAG: hypothetical protein UT84_C0006G0007 [Candidatus Curtissbacteria bacterium GW2011_GWA1_40_16]|uniref:Uncharacterized protein n=1 Tax=Candidatus Curtissbacteria bacterium GW2011_GWA1_40_16 TaxID=1618405 RepID=A0A0G0TUP4_9BACT|nr:MAG: hypothetical protein UT84_C0006G0007 [Candidatus Curtissbacteria bacterium GW2011_GWA1_40_16]
MDNIGVTENSQSQTPQSAGELDKLVAQTQQNIKVGVWGYVVLSLVFPPFTTIWAFYKAGKKQVLPLVLPAITIAFSIVIILSAFSSRATVGVPEQLTKLGVSANTGVSESGLILVDNLTIFLGIIGLVGGFYWRQKVKKENLLNSFAVWFMIAIIMLQMAAVSYLFYFVYQSAYSTVVPIIQSNYQGIN